MRVVVFLFVLVLGAAAFFNLPHPASAALPDLAHGFVHGVAAPVVLVIGWIWGMRIFTLENSGWYYDLGWLLGLFLFWVGGALLVRRL